MHSTLATFFSTASPLLRIAHSLSLRFFRILRKFTSTVHSSLLILNHVPTSVYDTSLSSQKPRAVSQFPLESKSPRLIQHNRFPSFALVTPLSSHSYRFAYTLSHLTLRISVTYIFPFNAVIHFSSQSFFSLSTLFSVGMVSTLQNFTQFFFLSSSCVVQLLRTISRSRVTLFLPLNSQAKD